MLGMVEKSLELERHPHKQSSQVVLVVKNSPANAGDIRDMGSIPVLGRSPERSHGNSLQYSCLENAIERGSWQSTVHGIAKNLT